MSIAVRAPRAPAWQRTFEGQCQPPRKCKLGWLAAGPSTGASQPLKSASQPSLCLGVCSDTLVTFTVGRRPRSFRIL